MLYHSLNHMVKPWLNHLVIVKNHGLYTGVEHRCDQLGGANIFWISFFDPKKQEDLFQQMAGLLNPNCFAKMVKKPILPMKTHWLRCIDLKLRQAEKPLPDSTCQKLHCKKFVFEKMVKTCQNKASWASEKTWNAVSAIPKRPVALNLMLRQSRGQET